MSDIDFDEIDKAVNSAVSGDDLIDESDSFSKNVVKVSTSPETVAKNQSPTIRRNSGQFMDVVHPSSNMRSIVTPTFQRPAQPPELEIPPAENIIPDVNDTTISDPIDFSSEPNSTDIVPNVEEVFENNDVAVEEISGESAETETPPETTVEQAAPASTLSQYESPFIDNPDVEKRPLGAFAGQPLEAEIEIESLAPVADDLSHDETVFSQVGAAAIDNTPDENPVEMLQTTESANDQIEAPEPNPVEVAAIEIEAQNDESENPPQKITSPSNQPVETSPYDAAAYQNPDAPKKSRVWLWILIIILLLAIGGAAGAWLYYSGML